jgi:two-component system, chemotaxis family, CheB/CheR fusion protein
MTDQTGQVDNDSAKKVSEESPAVPGANPDGLALGATDGIFADDGVFEDSDDRYLETLESPPGSDLALETEAEMHQGPALAYPVVGFGASAGGLQAFREILENLDTETGMAFVLVTHMAPDQKSFLAEIVERYTRMPVVQIEEGLRPLPNHLYVLLPNQWLTLRGGILHIEKPAKDRHPRTIDRFFHSLATDQKNRAIGVVLSGADSDGALGLKAIKGEGGIALVQTPDSAAHGWMPRSSIAADHVDLVIPPAEIAAELGRLGHQFSRPEVRSLEVGAASPEGEQSFQKILQLLRASSGLDLRQYKPETVRRRIARRMLLLRMDSLANYVRTLQARGDELHILQEDVLINVTFLPGRRCVGVPQGQRFARPHAGPYYREADSGVVRRMFDGGRGLLTGDHDSGVSFGEPS